MVNLTSQHLQDYVNRRAKESSHYFALGKPNKKNVERARRGVSATTIRKEVVTLGSAWRWAVSTNLLSGSYPSQGLRYPKTDEKPPFQTWEEIEQQIETGYLNPEDAEELWECLYLKKSEIAELLNFATEKSHEPFISPMFVMAAHTGARRSELMRSLRGDFNFNQNYVNIRERKRVRGRRSTRRVPLTPLLRNTMLDWFDNSHPGGPITFVRSNRTDAKPSNRPIAQNGPNPFSFHLA